MQPAGNFSIVVIRKQNEKISVLEFYRKLLKKLNKTNFILHAVSRIELLIFHIHTHSCKLKRNE